MKLPIFLICLILFCQITAETLYLDIMFTNDIHGGIDRVEAKFINPDFPPVLGGGGSAASYINEVRKSADGITRDNMLIDCGDFFQGHPIGTLTDGEAIIKYMNEIGYDFSVIGNHEYDIGEERLKNTLSLAEFPILSCNIVSKGTETLVDYVTPYIIVEKLGLKLAFIGLTTTDTEKMSFPDNIAGVDIISEKERLQKYIGIIREKEKPDLVFVAGHLGLPYDPDSAYEDRYLSEKIVSERYWGYDAQELAHEVNGIDIIFGGHMHKGFPVPWEDPETHTLVVQNYAYGSNIGHITLKIDKSTKSLEGFEMPSVRNGMLITLFEDEFIPDEDIAVKIEKMQNAAEKGMDEVIGDALLNIGKDSRDAQNAIGNLVCDAMRIQTGADFSFINLGGVRDIINIGPITYREIFNVMPFDNQVVLIEVTGEFLKEIIEMRVSGSRHGLLVSGSNIVYNRKRDNYDRVTKLEINNQPWQPDKLYKIATTDFLLEGNAGLNLLTKIPESEITRVEKSLRDIIVDYVRYSSPLSTKIDDRWERDDKSKKEHYLD